MVGDRFSLNLRNKRQKQKSDKALMYIIEKKTFTAYIYRFI